MIDEIRTTLALYNGDTKDVDKETLAEAAYQMMSDTPEGAAIKLMAWLEYCVNEIDNLNAEIVDRDTAGYCDDCDVEESFHEMAESMEQLLNNLERIHVGGLRYGKTSTADAFNRSVKALDDYKKSFRRGDHEEVQIEI